MCIRDSAYTQRTLDFFYQKVYPAFGPHVGVVIQSCLRRSTEDVARLVEAKARVRLCKGCLLYTSDAADERSSVDLGGRRIIKKKKQHSAARHRSS